MKSVIGFIPVASDFMSGQEANTIIAKYKTIFDKCNLKHVLKTDYIECDNLGYFILSGGVENTVLELIKKNENNFPDKPIALIAHPENNSLPAALELLARLHQDNYKGRIFFLSDTEEDLSLNEIHEYLNNRSLPRPLSGEKIGLIGAPSDWLIASSPELEIIKNVWGAEVKFYDTEILLKMIDEIPLSETDQLVSQFTQNAVSIKEPELADIADAVKIYVALKNLINTNKMDSFALRCFDLVTEKSTTGCYALAKLNQDGIPASCEGDLVSLLIMVWIKKVTGKTSWMANPAAVDAANNTLTLAHCTIAFDLIKSYHIRSHFESGLGVGIEGDIPLSPVTMVRLGGKNLDRVWIAEGTISGILNSENLCRTQAVITVEDKQELSKLLTDPLGNHIIMIQGHHRNSLYQNWNQFFS